MDLGIWKITWIILWIIQKSTMHKRHKRLNYFDKDECDTQCLKLASGRWVRRKEITAQQPPPGSFKKPVGKTHVQGQIKPLPLWKSSFCSVGFECSTWAYRYSRWPNTPSEYFALTLPSIYSLSSTLCPWVSISSSGTEPKQSQTEQRILVTYVLVTYILSSKEYLCKSMSFI